MGLPQVRLWTSAAKLDSRWELCAILNEVLRDDEPDQLPPAVTLTRAINTLCVKRGNLQKVIWPPNLTTYRGGGLPDERLATRANLSISTINGALQ